MKFNAQQFVQMQLEQIGGIDGSTLEEALDAFLRFLIEDEYASELTDFQNRECQKIARQRISELNAGQGMPMRLATVGDLREALKSMPDDFSIVGIFSGEEVFLWGERDPENRNFIISDDNESVV
jgi:hypothetical protein